MKSRSPQYPLKHVLSKQLDWHGARVSFLAHFIIALFKVKTVNLVDLATAFNGRVKPEFNYNGGSVFCTSSRWAWTMGNR